MKKWQEAERDVYLQTKELFAGDSDYVVSQDGDYDSTVPDIQVSNVRTGKATYVECKLIPSVAGAQLVVDTNKDGSLSVHDVKHSAAYVPTFLELANRHSANLNKTILLTGDDAVLAFKVLETKYAKSNVSVMAGVYKGKLIASTADVAGLSEFYVPGLIIRGKKSGSSSVSGRVLPEVKSLMEAAGVATQVENNKLFLADVSQVAEANTLFAEHSERRLFANDSGAVRKLANPPKSLTAILSLTPKVEAISGISDAEGRLKQLLVEQLG